MKKAKLHSVNNGKNKDRTWKKRRVKQRCVISHNKQVREEGRNGEELSAR